jgi:hypothetical protein
MKLDLSFEALAMVARSIGAEPTNWTLDSHVLPPPKTISVIEAEVTIDQVVFTDDGLATFEGQQVLLYIKEGGHSLDTLLREPADANRFHVSDCNTLQTMRANGRFEQRFVATNDTSGRFRCVAVDPITRLNERDEVMAALRVCKYCLRRLNYRGYADSKFGEKKRIWLSFSLEDFFKRHEARFATQPKRMDTDPSRNEYTPDWSDISRRYRENMKWICESCRVDLSKNRNLLQTHHIDGDKRNNAAANLEALCALCHQAHHPDMHVAFEARLKIMSLRGGATV